MLLARTLARHVRARGFVAPIVRPLVRRRRRRTRPSNADREESLDVAIVGGGIGGVALALALARNNLLSSTHHGVRCALCGTLCGGDYNGTAGALPITAEAFVALRKRQHHNGVHANSHAYDECFPARAIGASQRPSHPLTSKVFEKDACFSARQQGYGLTLQQGSAVLERLGLANAAQAEDTPSCAHYVFDGSGHLVNAFSSKAFGRASAPDEASSRERRRNLTIPRQRLRELLLEGLYSHGDGAVEWGWEYSGHAPREDGRLDVVFEQKGEGGACCRRTVVARVLVGADGIWSGVRERTLSELGVGRALDYLGQVSNLVLSCRHEEVRSQ